MLASWAHVKRLSILRDLDNVDDGFLASAIGTVLMDQFDNLIIVGVLQVVAVFMNGVALLEIFIDHERIIRGKRVFLETHQAAIHHGVLLDDRGQHVVAVVEGAESHV